MLEDLFRVSRPYTEFIVFMQISNISTIAFNYPSRDGPLFHRGHTIILGLLVFAWFMCVYFLLLVEELSLIYIGSCLMCSTALRSIETKEMVNMINMQGIMMTVTQSL